MFINVKITFIQYCARFNHLHSYSSLTTKFTKYIRLFLKLIVTLETYFIKCKTNSFITDYLYNRTNINYVKNCNITTLGLLSK